VGFDIARRQWAILAALALIWAAPALAAPAAATAPPAPQAAWAASKPTPAPAAPAPVAAPAPAAAASPAPDFADLAGDQQLLVKLQNQLPSTTNDQRLAAMGQEAAAIQAAADGRVAAADAQLSRVESALRKYPFDRPRRLSKTQAGTKVQLLAQSAAISAQLGQAQPVASLASQTFSQIAERRRESFSARVLEQTSSPLSPDFWTSLADNAGSDLGRLRSMILLSLGAAWAAPEPRGVAGLVLGILAAALFLIPLRMQAGRLGWRLCRRFGPAARTPAIVWTVVADVGAALLGAGAARLGLQWGGLLAPNADLMARAAVSAAVWAAAVVALGRALATDADPDHRLFRVSDGQALRTRVALVVVALVSASGRLLQRLDYVVGASVSATIAADCFVALAYAAAAMLLLVSFSPHGEERHADLPRAPARTVISLLLAAASAATIVSVLLGYATLAALISGQVFWLSLIAAITFLILRLIDDLCGLVATSKSRTARGLANLLGLKVSTVVQAGLLICAAVQLVLVLAAVTLALTPFGQSGELLVGHVTALGGSIHIGKATVSPLAIVAGLATFGFGVSLAHLARNWLERRYLPATDWDAGVRNSVSTGVAYLGVAVALLCAMGVTGIGFAQIALIASALSVGIGFGLQQIVQNFVAGVILLVERPVKVGDWVNVSGVEGDILDIRVRATEIRTSDRSTVMVPNSNLITTNVQNRTRGDLQTRINIQVGVAKAFEASKARETLLKVASGHEEVLAKPAPQVFIESLSSTAGAAVMMSLWVSIADPRQAHRIKSELYFAVLEDFEKVGLTLP
jgi:small-conductance mechanosensitive channel